ncbi:MAG: hypothetical protein ACK47B_11010 [Armatimonadota bacterium]
MSITVQRLRAEIGLDDRDYNQRMEQADRRFSEFGKSAERHSSRAAEALKRTFSGVDMTRLGDRMMVGVTLPLLAGGAAALKAASAVEEAENKIGVAFGRNARQVSAWAEGMADRMGQSRRSALQAAGGFGMLLKSLPRKEAAEMSMKLTELASDLASIHDIDPAEALEKLRAGLVGEAEPLRTVGVLLDENRVKQKALEMGLASSGKELDGNAKMMARYAIILDDTRMAQGDFGNTQDSAANASRRLKAQLEDLAASAGKELLPVAKDVLSVANDLAKTFNELPEGIRRTGVQFAILAAIAGPFIRGAAGLKGLLGKGGGAVATGAAAGAASALGAGGAGAVIQGGRTAATAATAAGQTVPMQMQVVNEVTPWVPVAAGAVLAGGGTALGTAPAAAGTRAALSAGWRAGGARGLAGAVGAGARSAGASAVGVAGASRLPVLLAALAGWGIGEWINDSGIPGITEGIGSLDRDAEARNKETAEAMQRDPALNRIQRLKRLLRTLPEGSERAAEVRARINRIRSSGGEDGVKNDEPEGPNLELRDATFARELARAGLASAVDPKDTQARREADALLPILRQRLQELTGRAEKSSGVELEKLRTEGFRLQEQLVTLEERARQEGEDAAREAQEKQRRAQEASHELARERAGMVLALAAEDQRAQAEAAAMLPVIRQEQARLIEQGRAAAEGSRERIEAEREITRLETEALTLQRAATEERQRNAEQLVQERLAVAAADAQAERARIDAELAGVEREQQARAEAARLIPQIRHEIETVIRPQIEAAKEGTAEYARAYQALWSARADIARLDRAAADEQRDAARKAIDETRRQGEEVRELAALRTRLLEAQLAAIPGLSDDQRKRALVPAMLEQFRTQLTAVAGETEKDRLTRLIEAAQLRGSILQAVAGDGGRGIRLAGGGYLGGMNERALLQANAYLSQVERQATLPSGRGAPPPVAVPITIQGRPDLRDPRTRAEIHAAVDDRLDEYVRRGYAR